MKFESIADLKKAVKKQAEIDKKNAPENKDLAGGGNEEKETSHEPFKSIEDIRKLAEKKASEAEEKAFENKIWEKIEVWPTDKIPKEKRITDEEHHGEDYNKSIWDKGISPKEKKST